MIDVIEGALKVFEENKFFEDILSKLSDEQKTFIETLKLERDHYSFENSNLKNEIKDLSKEIKEDDRYLEWLFEELQEKGIDLYKLGILNFRGKNGVKG